MKYAAQRMSITAGHLLILFPCCCCCCCSRDDFHTRPSSSSSSCGPPHPEDQSPLPRRQSSESSLFPPHVTISNAGGSVVQYHPFPDCVLEEQDGSAGSGAPRSSSSSSSSRSWRSHSLTPTTPSNMSEAEWAIQKARSNSLTFGAKDHHHHQQHQGQFGGRAGSMLSSASSGAGSNTELEGHIEEMLNRLPQGSGMRGKSTFMGLSLKHFVTYHPKKMFRLKMN